MRLKLWSVTDIVEPTLAIITAPSELFVWEFVWSVVRPFPLFSLFDLYFGWELSQ